MKFNYQAVMHCSCCQREFSTRESTVVKQEAKCWGGVTLRAVCVCVCVHLGTIHYTIRGSRRIWYVRMRSLCMKQNCSPVRPAQTHINSSMSTQPVTHTHTSFYGNSKQTVHACGDPTPAEKKAETKTARQNQTQSKRQREGGSGTDDILNCYTAVRFK